MWPVATPTCAGNDSSASGTARDIGTAALRNSPCRSRVSPSGRCGRAPRRPLLMTRDIEASMSCDSFFSPAPGQAAQPRYHVKYSRRNFLTVGASSAALPLFARHLRADTARSGAAAKDIRDPLFITLEINGRKHRMALDARRSLLDALRENAGLTGAKKGCDHGQCGACTVLIG